MFKKISMVVMVCYINVVVAFGSPYFVEDFNNYDPSKYTNSLMPGSGRSLSWFVEEIVPGDLVLRVDYFDAAARTDMETMLQNDAKLKTNFIVQTDLRSTLAEGNYWAGLIVSEGTNPFAAGIKSIRLWWKLWGWEVEFWTGNGNAPPTASILGTVGSTRTTWPIYNLLTIQRIDKQFTFNVGSDTCVINPIDGNYKYAGFIIGHWELAGMSHFDNLTYTELPGPTTCEEAIARGYALPADVDQNCHVNFQDFAVLALQWMMCNEPATSGCTPNWQ